MKNNIVNLKEYKTIKDLKNKKKDYFVDFIDWKNYTLLIKAESKQDAEEIAVRMVEQDEITAVPTKHLFEILKVQGG